MRRPATEAMLTIAPPPLARICGITAWMPLNVPPRLISSTRSHSSVDIVASVLCVIVPAQLTNTSIPPAEAAISLASLTQPALSDTSSLCAAAFALWPISAATRSAATPSRSMTQTLAPAMANCRQVAAPMPLPPPVTRTVFAEKSAITSSCIADRSIARCPDSSDPLCCCKAPWGTPMTYAAPLADMRLVLHTLGNLSAEAAEVADAVLEEAAKFAENELAPLNRVGDEVGSHLENGVVRTPPGFREAYRTYIDGGWNGLASPVEAGGQGLPQALAVPLTEVWNSACMGWALWWLV